ncbi:zinc finger C2H2-type/integrase DNA-binding domain-containing protein [Artemisia annua]|uniref:Zinc finger C2H2-type/integrase DNA-binding domain-containing protein n=1 Tax=Artemisia annua TaxID=35608 RepID=A0A2U1KE99_ARTAN|nr:zinc finger C2H2-type/integrase DNA-binding domain-containing protein [Artemisia annua]
MKSQEGFTQNAETVLSSTPVRKIVIRLKTPTNPNTIILNGETSCFSNTENMNGKRVLAMDWKNEFQETIKKAKGRTNVASTSNALYKPAATRYDETKKLTDTFKKRKVHVEKRKNLVISFVNSQCKPACPLCRENCVSNKFLYQHMAFHTDKDWKRFTRSLNTHNVNKSGQDHNHDAKVVDLSKCLFGWDVKTRKRSRLGSSVAGEAAKILVLMARDPQLKAKTSIMAQSEVQAVNGLVCIGDPVTPSMVESGAQVEELMATSMTERNLQVE